MRRNELWNRKFLAVAALLAGFGLALLAPWAGGDPSLEQLTIRRPAGVRGTVVVPDHFLRRWDPVTVFFDRDAGPKGGGPEDHPERLVRLNPDHPGAWRWIDARTLQFRPAMPWPPLRRFSWQVDGKTTALDTLMVAPHQVLPADGSEGLEAVEAITLTFADPLEPGVLADMVRIELRPLPGTGQEPALVLTKEDFSIKELERRSPSSPATYVIGLKEPLPAGIKATVRFRLSLDDEAAGSFTEVGFSTREPFRPLSLGCGSARVPLTSDGSRYGREQALACDSTPPTVDVQLSAAPGVFDPLVARDLVRFEPTVDNLTFTEAGRGLTLGGDFQRDTLYRVTLEPAPLTDGRGRPLEIRGPSEVWLYFPRQPPFLRWRASHGIVERFGPQQVPLEGQGLEKVDLRIYPIPASSRSLWPFPDQPVMIDEFQRPPAPGEAPLEHTGPQRIDASTLARHIHSLGSPPVSEIVSLPLRREGAGGAFGLELGPHLARINGPNRPGHYLVGVRRLDRSTERAWMRIQVTDLTLTTIEGPKSVQFVVTSIASGRPVPGATIRLEGTESDSRGTRWTTLMQGVTDRQGALAWTAPGNSPKGPSIGRIVLEKEGDVLVLDPGSPPESYSDNLWRSPDGDWLRWAFGNLSYREPGPVKRCHLFTERPVYRPDQEVHLKGYLRERHKGRLTVWTPTDAELVIDGPGDLEWRLPVEISKNGSFYHRFEEEDLPTGGYLAWLEVGQERFGNVSWKMEAYRIPRFEVEMHGPDQAPLDAPFDMALTASYYAGGRVGGRPVRWRVTQFPYTWNFKKRPGFLYSSDGRYSRTARFEAGPALEKEDTSDPEGQAKIQLNPALEPTAQPRSYVIEATVTGDDDQTVTSTRHVVALPPFVLGLKTERYLERTKQLTPEVVMMGFDGRLIAGREVTVRLLQRQWHSHLRAGDFSEGVARYVTDVVDEKVLETTVTTKDQPVAVPMPVPRAGVYVVELEARDRLGRAQVVAVDLYAGGEEPVTWGKPAAGVFTVTPDKKAYDPGETATLVMQSPYQSGEALVVIEAPEGNTYQWVSVKGGTGVVKVPVRGHYVPRLPVHVVLMRGRVPGVQPVPGTAADLGRPSTVAATAWLSVNPVDNRVEVALEHPAKARPGEVVPMTVKLRSPQGKPLAGEVTLWLVDAAVLALGREQRLEPVDDFITPVNSGLQMRDTRNLSFGFLPFAIYPGGDGPDGDGDLLDRATVRKNFDPVPYYEPSIQVGSSGTARVSVPLPDNLTTFKVRAKAISGAERFGYATSQVAVRLPVIVEPDLPRFVRPGDSFMAGAIGRIVEGGGGAGAAQLKAEGVSLEGPAARKVAWDPARSERLEFPVRVHDPSYTADGRLAYDQVTFRVGVERASDRSTDAFEVKLPVRDDRPRVTRVVMHELEPGQSAALPEVPAEVRPGTVKRSVLVSDQPKLVRMAAGLDFLRHYPYGCTEQRLSRARVYLATRQLRALLHLEATPEEVDRVVRQTLEWLPTAVDGNGLVGYWPGSRGFVSLSAWALEFLVAAKEAGYPVEAALFDGLVQTLKQALRSDYGRFIDGEAWSERTWALSALAAAGRFDAGYGAELARQAQFLDQEGRAQVVAAFARAGQGSAPGVASLADSLWSGLVFKLHQGKEIFAGLQARGLVRSGLILPGETRALAETLRALGRVQADHPKLPLLVDALVTLGRDDGWGSTNANSAALVALSEQLEPPFAGSAARAVQVKLGSEAKRVAIGPEAPMGYLATTATGPGEVRFPADQPAGRVLVRATASFVPGGDGSRLEAESQGFVVSRELLRIRPDGQPAVKVPLAQAGLEVPLEAGEVIEEHVHVVNPVERHYVAVVVPLAAGMEPLNPRLATAPPEARPDGQLTLEPTYAAWLDDHVAFYFNSLPKGTYDFYFRVRANTAGRFTQPAATAEMMYDQAVRGASNAAKIVIRRGS